MLEEPQLNGLIASVINKTTNSAGWQAREELSGALRGPKTSCAWAWKTASRGPKRK